MTRNEIYELAKQCNRSISWVYAKFKKYGKALTLQELLKLKGKSGRKPKYN